MKDPKWTTTETSVKLSFPLNVKIGGAVDGATDGAREDALSLKIDGATKSTKAKLSELLKAIVKDEGKRTPDYRVNTNLGSERTMERYIEQLKEAGFIEFVGSAPQTGGYFISEKLKSLLKS